ncbi:hypothetical protein ACFLWO_04370, partial [Chloroflexota bacterium]
MRIPKKFLVLALVSILLLTSFLIPLAGHVLPARAAGAWTKYTGEVTLGGERYVLDASVIKDGGTYKMWYTQGKTELNVADTVTHLIDIISGSGIIDFLTNMDLDGFLNDLVNLDVDAIQDLTHGGSAVIGYATSGDGKTWTVQNSEVLAGPGLGIFFSVGTPNVVKSSNGTYEMWYTHIVMDLTPTDLSSLLSDMGDSGLRADAIYELLNSISTTILYTTSDDGITWTASQEVLAGGAGVANNIVADPTVAKNSDGTYEMWYTRSKTDLTPADLDALPYTDFHADDLYDLLNGTTTSIYHATSTDGITWTGQQEVLPGNGTAWGSVADPSVVKTGTSTYEMWYTNGRTDLTQADFPFLLGEIASLAGSGWSILEAYESGDFTELLAVLSDLDLGTLRELLGDTNTVIGYATSSNGVDWTVQNAQHLTGSSGNPWSSVFAPTVVTGTTGSYTYEMWYTQGIADATFGNLLALMLGGDLPIGYAYSGRRDIGAGLPPAPTSGPGAEEAAPGPVDVSDVVTDDGVFTEDVTAESEDGKAELTIDEDTTGLTAEGEPISEISVALVSTPAPATGGWGSVGGSTVNTAANTVSAPLSGFSKYAAIARDKPVSSTYELLPSGATFDPPITVTFDYDSALIPEGVSETEVVIAKWEAMVAAPPTEAPPEVAPPAVAPPTVPPTVPPAVTP